MKRKNIDKEKIIGSTTELVIKETTTTRKSDDVVVISGYANRYLDQNGQLVIDRSQEAVLPQGYDIESFMKNPILLYSHQKDQPIGKIIALDIRVDGLYIEAEVHKAMNEKAFYGVQNGILKTFSIGFMIKDYAEVDDVYLWTATELLEVSIVSVPDNQESLFSIMTDAPCQSGVCLLGNKAVSKQSIVKHNKELKTKEWSSVDKTELKERFETNDESIVKDAYLVVKDVNDKDTWKFPHHDYEDGVLILNVGGVKSAFSALKSVQDNDILNVTEKLEAAEHLKGHFEELLADGLIEEALLENLDEFISGLKQTGDETLKVKDNETEGTEVTETGTESTEPETTETGEEGTEEGGEESGAAGTEQSDDDATINTPENAEEDDETQDPDNGEGETKSDSTEIGLAEIQSFIGVAKSSEEGLNQLFALYAEIEEILNEALSKNQEEE